MARKHPFSFRTSKEAITAYKASAERAGLSVSEWARLVLDAAAGSSDFPEQLARVVKFREVRDGKW